MTEDSPPTPPFHKAFHGLSRVRKMLEVVSCAVSRYVRTFLRLGVRPDEVGIARDRSFSEGDIGIRNSVSREWPRSNSFTSLSFKTQLTHMSLCSLGTPSFLEDNLLSVSRHGTKCRSVWNMSSMSNLDIPNEIARSETPKYLGYGRKYDNIPWITTPRSLTASEHSGDNSNGSPLSKKSNGKSPHGYFLIDNDNIYDTPENVTTVFQRPTSLLIPYTPAFNMSPRDFHFFNLRKKIWRNLYWQDAIKWEEDQATIRDILRKQEELERAILQIPELNLPTNNPPELPNDPEIPINQCQSGHSSNNLQPDVPDITITFSDDFKTSISTISTEISWCSEKLNSCPISEHSSSIDSSMKKSCSDNISQDEENWACFDQIDLIDDKMFEKLQTSV